LISFAYQPSSASFDMHATSTSAVTVGDRTQETEVYIPPLDRGSVAVNGAAALDDVVVNPDGSRLAYVAPTGKGAYEVTVN
jgi:hypothetical protein